VRIHKYNPAGRLRSGDKTEVEIVSEPDRRWFLNVTPCGNDSRIVRFALMTDGVLYFGDAYHVLHHDMCQARGAVGDVTTEPLVVGVMVQMQDGLWYLSNAQLFGHGHDDDVLTTTRGLLRALTVWPSVVAAMEQTDPLDMPRCGEEEL
jgi:hypothetical protein